MASRPRRKRREGRVYFRQVLVRDDRRPAMRTRGIDVYFGVCLRSVGSVRIDLSCR